MTALLFWHLNATCRGGVPEAIFGRLQDHFVRSAATNRYFTEELFRILDLFEQSRIQAIPFKGPVLAQMLYENPALREYVDVDILAQEQDLFRALELLPALGYRKIPDHSPAVAARILKWEYHYPVEKQSGQHRIELHWNALPRYYALPLPIHHWWERAESISLQGRRVLSLSGEDLLMALCVHGCRHMWRSIGLILDMARLLDMRSDLNWDRMFEKYPHPTHRRMLLFSLAVARDVLGVNLSEEIMDRIQQEAVAAVLAREARDQLFQGSAPEGLPFRLMYRLNSGWPDRIRYCLHSAATPRLIDWSVALPRPLFPLYFVLRPLRIFGSHLSHRISKAG